MKRNQIESNQIQNNPNTQMTQNTQPKIKKFLRDFFLKIN
ncbi:hypothetical protein DOY81_003885 [Sarcophaga bullata]|nr:hypothetical protein DOY81_003885 [Sarcophaga bullata]